MNLYTAHRRASLYLCVLCAVALTGCHHSTKVSQYPASNAPTISDAPEEIRPLPAVRRPTPSAPVVSNEPMGKPVSTEIGLASWYGPPYHNHPGADGTIFDQNAITVAHRTLPMGTMVRVTNVATGESVVAKVTDRGPFVQGRALDLSLAAA